MRSPEGNETGVGLGESGRSLEPRCFLFIWVVSIKSESQLTGPETETSWAWEEMRNEQEDKRG